MKKGFTLIELLAVIVILAIIALIAVPIILNIIDDAEEKSAERSIELYASAVNNAIAEYRLNNTVAPEDFSDLTIEYDGDVECKVQILYSDKSIYLDECTVNGGEKEYSYGKKQTACTLEDKDGDKVASLSDIVTCGTESFYVMNNENNEITMLSMYNLNVGANKYPNEATYGIQDENVYGYKPGYTTYGTVFFSTTYYWESGNYSPAGNSSYNYVYDKNSNLYQYVSEYERILTENLKVNSAKTSLISYEQVRDLIDNKGEPSWLYSTSYWTGSAGGTYSVWTEGSYSFFDYDDYVDGGLFGVRPVVTISTSEIS